MINQIPIFEFMVKSFGILLDLKYVSEVGLSENRSIKNFTNI